MRTKAEIRAEMRTRRRAVDPPARRRASETLCEAILARDDVRAAIAARRPFAVYLASVDELDLAPLVAALWSAGVTVAVPRWDEAARAYALAVYDTATVLVEGPHHIPEPNGDALVVASADIGVWIVPGLAFTSAGARLGYGGGWYDRYLADSALDAIALGVAYPFQIVDALPVESHDRVLTAVVVAS